VEVKSFNTIADSLVYTLSFFLSGFFLLWPPETEALQQIWLDLNTDSRFAAVLAVP